MWGRDSPLSHRYNPPPMRRPLYICSIRLPIFTHSSTFSSPRCLTSTSYIWCTHLGLNTNYPTQHGKYWVDKSFNKVEDQTVLLGLHAVTTERHRAKPIKTTKIRASSKWRLLRTSEHPSTHWANLENGIKSLATKLSPWSAFSQQPQSQWTCYPDHPSHIHTAIIAPETTSVSIKKFKFEPKLIGITETTLVHSFNTRSRPQN
jgi:hypothetical protein